MLLMSTERLSYGLKLENLDSFLFSLTQKFFRRGLLENASYRCKNGGQCAINPQTRNLCRYCRFWKCISVGMSRNGKNDALLQLEIVLVFISSTGTWTYLFETRLA